MSDEPAVPSVFGDDDTLETALARAAAHLDRGEAEDALSLVTSIPPGHITTRARRSTVAELRHRAFLAIMEKALPQDRWRVLNQAQRIFFYAAHEDPGAQFLYEQYAELWSCAGHGAMAQRIAASVRHVFPECDIGFEGTVQRHKPPAYGEWSGNYRPRTLILAQSENDYGVDTLYDGLCQLLGHDRVTEFPYKPGLHGKMTHEQCRYPCLFNYPGEPWDIRDLAQELLAGKFDLVIYADAIGRTNHTAMKALIKAATGTPVVIYDAGDDCADMRREMCDRVGIESCLAYFKREMLDAVDYGPNAWPLPFGYAEAYVPEAVETPRTEELFWAGTPAFGMRPLYLPHLRKVRSDSFDRKYTQEEYTAALLRSRAGLCLFGWGFDTVRYWELPAHGAMLLAEHPPIHIPNNFVDGDSALFFDDLRELEHKLAYIEAHPDHVSEIAASGHAHFREHHSTTTRARQFLGTIESLVSPP